MAMLPAAGAKTVMVLTAAAGALASPTVRVLPAGMSADVVKEYVIGRPSVVTLK